MATRFMVADRCDGRLFACIAEARFETPCVSASRLCASLHPYPDLDTALAALKAAGGENPRLANG